MIQKIPNTTKLQKYAKKTFKSGRLKKKQITRLENSYIRLCKKYKILSMSLTETMIRYKDIPIAKPIERERSKLSTEEIEKIKADSVGEYKRLSGKTDEEIEKEAEEFKKEIEKMIKEK